MRLIGVLLLVVALGVPNAKQAAALDVSGLLQLSIVDADSQPGFINNGTGVLRYDENAAQIQQALLNIQHDLGGAFSAEVTANVYPDGDLHAGLTQALIKWKPLSQNVFRTRARAGFFYPRMSAESVDIGWLSPYSYTPSAINSWFGEELRVAGVEASLFSLGRTRRSPWSVELNAALYGGNDPLGTPIAWRGFATHDRQSLHHDRLQFAPYPSVVESGPINGPDWVEPFHEIDDRLGVYAGFHVKHRRGLDLRAYYYDNNGDPMALNAQRLYAWHTRFRSLAMSYDLTENSRLLAHWIGGTTEMGPALVLANFDSYYLMLSHRRGPNRLSLRYERWDVDETDDFPEDSNNSEGAALTVALRHDLTKNWQLGIEYIDNRTEAENRVTVNQPIRLKQQQWLAVLQYRF